VRKEKALSQGPQPSVIRVPIAAVLAWFVPGGGHFYLGYRAHALIAFVVITTTFWSGVAIGSVQGTVAPKARKLWFMAQICTGDNTLAAVALHRAVDPDAYHSPRMTAGAHWLSAEVGVHYTGVAGLLNLLLIIDAIVRADPGYRGARPRRKIDEGVP